jgi:hypothetical protein
MVSDVNPYLCLTAAVLLASMGHVVAYARGPVDGLTPLIVGASSASSLALLWFAQQAYLQRWTARPQLTIEMGTEAQRQKVLVLKNEGGPSLRDISIHACRFEIAGGPVELGDRLSFGFVANSIYRLGTPIFTARHLASEDEQIVDLKPRLTFAEYDHTQPMAVEAFSQYVLRIVFYHSITRQKYVTHRLVSVVSGFPSFFETGASKSTHWNIETSQRFIALRQTLVDHEREFYRDKEADLY